EDRFKRMLQSAFYCRATLYDHQHISNGYQFQRHALVWLRHFSDGPVLDPSKEFDMAKIASKLRATFTNAMTGVCQRQAALMASMGHCRKRTNAIWRQV